MSHFSIFPAQVQDQFIPLFLHDANNSSNRTWSQARALWPSRQVIALRRELIRRVIYFVCMCGRCVGGVCVCVVVVVVVAVRTCSFYDVSVHATQQSCNELGGRSPGSQTPGDPATPSPP